MTTLNRHFSELLSEMHHSAVRQFLDSNFERVDFNGCSFPNDDRIYHSLHTACLVRRFFTINEVISMCRILIEYGVDIQSLYPHILVNGIKDDRNVEKGERFLPMLQLIEDSFDYCLYVDDAFVEGRPEVIPFGYRQHVDEDYLMKYRGIYPDNVPALLTLMLNRYGSLSNVYVRFDPIDLDIYTSSILHLVIDCNLISIQWRYYIAQAAIEGTVDNTKVWNQLGVISNGWTYPEDVGLLVDVSLIMKCVDHGHIVAAKQLLGIFQRMVSPRFFRLVIDCALFYSFSKIELMKYLVENWNANPNRRFVEYTVEFVETYNPLYDAEIDSFDLWEETLQTLFLQYFKQSQGKTELDWDAISKPVLHGHVIFTLVREDCTILHMECLYGSGASIHRIRYLVEHAGADLWVKMGRHGVSPGFTVFHLACGKHKQAVLKYFIERAMNNAINNLWFDEYKGPVLFDEESDAGTVQPVKVTALMLACHKALFAQQTVKTLIDTYDPNVNAVDSEGETLLFRLIKSGNVDPLKFVVKQAHSQINFKCRSKDGLNLKNLLKASDPVIYKTLEPYLPTNIITALAKEMEQKLGRNKKKKVHH